MDLSSIDVAGNRLFTVFTKIGFWIILSKCVFDLIRCAVQGDLHTLGKTVIQYVLLYASIFFVPFAMHLVEGIF
ncbi:MAG: hypothetical protein VB060_00840 [Oscillibacter sp.]|nr:hypothetical protein [Oscillibacter sp.]MEA4992366.1 hypothetical protein [Oscillibacter sp.]